MSEPQTQVELSETGPLVVLYNDRRVLLPRHPRIEDMKILCRNTFFIPQGHNMSFHTEDIGISGGQLTEILSDVWAAVISQVSEVTLRVEPNSAVIVTIDFEGREAVFKASPNCRFEKIANAFCTRTELDECEMRFTYEGRRIVPEDVLQNIFGNQTNPYVDVYRARRGGKPVIYVYSPQELEAVVKLSLAPQWSISAVYPVIPRKITSKGMEQVQWRVRTQSNGDLTELTTGLDVAYLFWEANTNAEIPPSPPASPSTAGPVETFDPARAALGDHNSVVLPSANITPYLDAALKAMGLHTEARTSFITYWLPSILKHKNVALRFVPQSAYEKAAPLDVSPVPDVVARVFMLFQGVEDAHLEAGGWVTSVEKARNDPSFWAGVVGVDSVKTMDKALFRVIEWGGMEVTRPRPVHDA